MLRYKKRLLVSVLVAIFLVSLVPASAFAAVKVRLNGAVMTFSVEPRNEEGRLLVPMRAIFEALGASIVWNGERQEVTATAGGRVILLRIGDRTALVDGQPVLLDVAPKIVAGSTLVPLRFVSESLGAAVRWDASTETVWITSAGAAPAPPATMEELLARALPATVLLLVESPEGVSVGTGFFLDDTGMVVTNYHVLERIRAATVLTYDKKEHRIQSILAADAGRDLAIIQTTARGYQELPLAAGLTLTPGHKVIAIGHPAGLQWSVSDGIISSVDRSIDKQSWIQHTAPISPGSSGGPLISVTTGEIVGINTMLVAGEAMQNLNFAAPVSAVMEVFDAGLKDDPEKGAAPVGTGGSTGTQPPPTQTPPPTQSAPDLSTLPAMEPVRPAGDWPSLRGDLLNRAAVASGPGVQLKSLWTLSSGVHSARLTLYQSTLYAASGTSPGELTALEAETGKVRWTKRMGSTVSPATAGPHGVYVSEFRKSLVAYKHDGTALFKVPVQAESPPVLLSDKVLVADAQGTLYAYDPQTGQELWSVALGQGGFAKDHPPAHFDQKLYLTTSTKTFVIDTSKGMLLNAFAYGSSTAPVLDGGLLYLTDASLIRAVHPLTGQEVWKADAGGTILRPPAAAGGLLLVTGGDAWLHALDGRTGKRVWDQELDAYGSGYGTPVAAGDLVYVGAYGGGIKAFQLKTGETAGLLLPGLRVPGPVVVTGSRLYVASDQWGVHALVKP